MEEKVTSYHDAAAPPPGYRCFTAQSVLLPPAPWYRKVRVPGFTRRTSPYTNVVRTTKYTVFNFVPKNLWEQFHRGANLYFVFIIFLNLVPELEVFGKEIAFIPVLFVLLVTAVKDIFEDYRRYRSDKEVNSKQARVYDREARRFEEVQWKDVRLGDFVEVLCDAAIPADLLLIRSSDTGGVCYIETATLDGETNLKQRQAVLQNQQQHNTEAEDGIRMFEPGDLKGEVWCEQPHEKIYEFNGYIASPCEEHVPITRSNLLLRSCVLRNTTAVIGLVVYAGHETKAMLNNTGPRYKRSKLEKDINIDVIVQVVILVALCLVGGIGNGVWSKMQLGIDVPYYIQRLSPALSGFTTFWSFIILLQVIVPISLYVSIEIVKLTQVYFINWDISMYHQQTNRPFQCRALTINEDLGQIEYVFSDKTGTLTENEMVFRCCSIGGINYAHSVNFGLTDHGTEGPKTAVTTPVQDTALVSALQDSSLRGECIQDFFLNIVLCNTVVVVTKESHHRKMERNKGSILPGDVVYEAESPDEAALVEAARAYGYTLTAKSQHWATVHTPHHGPIKFQILQMLEFDSVRKCMSVVVQEAGTDRLVLYSKGADATIYRNLSHSNDGTNTTTAVTEQHLSMYSKLGLRTLCLAKRALTKDEYQGWLNTHHQAQLSLEDRESLLFESARRIERQLELLGATGVEDRLQDGVPETIEGLRMAGINVWVLTGDKQETAVSIGYSSKLFNPDMDVIVLNATSQEECREMLNAHKEEIYRHMEGSHVGSHNGSITSSSPQMSSISLRPLYGGSFSAPPSSRNRALVLDGQTMGYILTDSRMRGSLLEVVKCCKSVLCCRATPLQKAEVVRLVKKELGVMTLAVGDGANDVSMIQTASVGVGIAGKEGNQAVIASDFSMARFKFLERLLLVHGHWSYFRLANMMLYFFYKNVAYAAVLFWYQLFNGFSASTPIDGVNLIIFNLIYTSLPILVVAIADQDLGAYTLQARKSFYVQGRESKVYTRWKFWLTMVDALYESAVVFFVAYGAYISTDVGVAEFGVVINFSIVITTSLHLAVETMHWTWVHHVVLWGSIGITFIFNLIYMAIDTQQNTIDTYWVLYVAATRPTYWFVLLATPVIALLPRLVAKVIEQELFPSCVLQARVMEGGSRGGNQEQFPSLRTHIS